jgi:signal peptide peptidase SppA
MAVPQTPLRAILARLPIERFRKPPPVVAVVRLAGVIGQLGPWRGGLSLAQIAPALERAFRTWNLKAVALAVNSPGGSPVQSALIAGRVRALADENDVPVFAFAEDVAASGGYWLACAADEIFADENSIVGSIGVMSQGFGFVDLIKRAGVERRLYTAGERKTMLDPFLKEKPDEVGRLKAIQEDMHESFKAMVRRRRGARLKAPEEVLFNGEFWTGRRAFELGLIDGLGDLRSVLRQRLGDDVKFRLVTGRSPWWRRRFGFAGATDNDPADWAGRALAAVEERLMWGRFGL